MWIVYAFGSAFFAGLTSILVKCGVKRTDSTIATAIRTIVVLVFAWIMVFAVGSQDGIKDIASRTMVFLILSGLATGASWLCYFKALQIGNVNKVVPIDKFSTVLTMILAFIILGEAITWVKLVGMIGIAVGTYLMIQKKEAVGEQKENKAWLFYALASAVFASLTSILGKIGISNVESNLGTAIRTIMVLIMAWVMVFVSGKQKELYSIEKKELGFISLSGIATGASWLCYYRALQEGEASLVVPIDKLSIVVTVIFAYIVFKEKLNRQSLMGLILIVAGTVVMLI